ncbi:MAG: leucine-rich repeat domain-containing protein [Clostridia bacterium]|nr:leucine-rich repeat domain-containing protein [Clostridia bacterium]
MWKTLAFLLTILLCLTGAFSLAEEAGEVEQETFTCEEYEYALLDDGTAEITKYHGEAETLEVPDELDGYAVTAIGDGAFYGCFGLTDVTIHGSVTAIGDGVFFGCFDLTDVTIPDSVTAIGDSAFAFCYGLTAITIPDSVTAIGANPFYHCNSLTQITVSPDHPVLETIGGVLFNKPDKLLVTYPCAFTDSEYVIPQDITIQYCFSFHIRTERQ